MKQIILMLILQTLIVLNISINKLNYFGNKAVQPDPNVANKFLKNAAIAVPLKYLSKIWRSLEMPLINCK